MSNVDLTFIQRELEKLKAERHSDRSSGGGHTGGNGTSNGGGGDLEARVARLESHVEYMRRDISDLKTDVKAIANDVVDIKIFAKTADLKLDTIDKNMVTKGKIAFWALVGMATVVGSAVGAAWWLAQQYLGPLLKALPH